MARIIEECAVSQEAPGCKRATDKEDHEGGEEEI
jgi:hypothetical protein